METEDENNIRDQFNQAKKDYEEIGGWESLKNGEWLFKLIQKCFRNYFDRANVEYFQEKYGTKDQKKIEAKLISVAARNALILGGVAGAAVSADELIAIFTAAEGGLGLPANIAIGLAAVGSEAILLIRLQLQLIASLGKLHGVPLDPDDPEDILTILAFAIGGSAAEAAGKVGMKIGAGLGKRAAKAVFQKELLASLKRIAAKIGVKILQGTIVKYTVPIISIGIGSGWNYFSTRTVGKLAVKHFVSRVADLGKENIQEEFMAFSFSFATSGKMENKIQEAKKAVSEAGGTLDGDSQSGMFSGVVEGTYAVSDATITVTITKKPFWATNGMIENKIKAFFA